MKIAIRKLGNSRGVIIPKPLLDQVGLKREADVLVENNAIVLRPSKKRLRQGWADASRRIAAAGDDRLVWSEFANESDAELKW